MHNNRNILIEVHRIAMFLSLRIVRFYQCLFLIIFIFAIRLMAYYVNAAFYLLAVVFAMQEILYILYKNTAKTKDSEPLMPLLCHKYNYIQSKYLCNNISSTVTYLLLLFLHIKFTDTPVFPDWITYTPLILLLTSIVLQLILYIRYRIRIHNDLINGAF